MELERSFPHSQVPATCPYPETALSSPCSHILLPEDSSLTSENVRLKYDYISVFQLIALN